MQQLLSQIAIWVLKNRLIEKAGDLSDEMARSQSSQSDASSGGKLGFVADYLILIELTGCHERYNQSEAVSRATVRQILWPGCLSNKSDYSIVISGVPGW